IEDLGHILLVALFRLADISAPCAWIPDFHPMIQADQNNFLVLIQRNNLSEPTRNQNASGFVDFRRASFRDNKVHEQPTLVFIKGCFRPLEDFLPLFHGIDERRLFWTFEEDDGLSLRLNLLTDRRGDDKSSLLIHFAQIFTSKHQWIVSFTTPAWFWCDRESTVPDPNARSAILFQA